MDSFRRMLLRRVFFPIAKLYWQISPGIRNTVKVVIESDGKILLVRQSFAAQLWTLPGGTTRRDESPEEAARREVAEEVGIQVENLLPRGTFFYPAKNKVTVFSASPIGGATIASKLEILEIRWFDPQRLPEDISVGLVQAIEIYTCPQKLDGLY